MPQSGRDLYSQLNIVWPGRELTGPRDPFAAEVKDHFHRVLDRVTPFMIRTPKRALGLPEATIVRHAVELSELEAQIYNLVVQNLRRRVDAAGSVERARLEALRRGRPLRLIQAATNPELLGRLDLGIPIPPVSGAPTLLSRLDTYDPLTTPAAKSLKAIEVLTGVVAEQEKAVVWSSFIANLDRFSELAKARLQVPVFQVDGRIATGDEAYDDNLASPADAPETREQVISSFLSCRGPALLVANPASCSESISLHMACQTAVYLDRTYDCAQWLQSIDRIHRLGLPPTAKVVVHILQAVMQDKPTADFLVDSALLRKEEVMRQLLEGAELGPIGQSDNALADAEGDFSDLHEMLKYLLGIAP
ncbi:hypothetical protein Aph01nite_68040 [Acrocarpospora phusangensis]|uniref:Helicase C-terminal domain-containing protein n=2 Tax=Acrocarpospora phusangensis TaxID=1070424 RepID=A0A919QI79_9ACTN|nr:hypothetical protein Aph01nite_68040 [Acrocarpospora phusangensis]